MRHWTYRKMFQIGDVNQWVKEELDVLEWKKSNRPELMYRPAIVWNWRLEDLEADYDVTKSSRRKI
jgi:hypothetical protein